MPSSRSGTTRPCRWFFYKKQNNAHSAVPSDDPTPAPFSNVETTFRLRPNAQFSKFETNQPLVDKA